MGTANAAASSAAWKGEDLGDVALKGIEQPVGVYKLV